MSIISDKCIEQMKNNQKIVMSAEDMMDFKNATHCSICEEPIDTTENHVEIMIISQGHTEAARTRNATKPTF